MADVLDEIRALFRERGACRYDEKVTQEQHALQTAFLAEQAGAPASQVAASLLHDIGHLIVPRHSTVEDLKHEDAGAAWLAARFPESVHAVVRLHVDAKRYLVLKDADYHDSLSSASKTSLRLQGGPFSEDQAAEFIGQPFAPAALDVRRWDDMAKSIDADTPGLDHFLHRYVAPLVGA